MIAFRAHPYNPRYSPHLKILYFIIFIKYLLPYKVTFMSLWINTWISSLTNSTPWPWEMHVHSTFRISHQPQKSQPIRVPTSSLKSYYLNQVWVRFWSNLPWGKILLHLWTCETKKIIYLQNTVVDRHRRIVT